MFTTRTSFPALRTQKWIGLGIATAGIWLAWHVGGWIAAEDLGQVELLAMVIAVGVIAVAILRDWRSGFHAFILWVVFEDLVRKYQGNNMVIFFAKDVLAGITYVSLFIAVRDHRDKVFRPPFLLALSCFFWLAVLQMFNPYSPSIFYGLLGVKIYFFYVPLMFVGYALIRDDRDLTRFICLSVVLAGLVAGLGVVQGIFGPQFLNPTVLAPEIQELGRLAKVTPISHQVVTLPTAVFVSAGRFATYLVLAAILGIGGAGYLILSRPRGRWIIFGSLGMIAAAVAICGSRGALILSTGSAVILIMAFLWGAPWQTRQVHRLLKAIRRAAVVMVLTLSVAIMVFPKQIGTRWDFYMETLSPQSSASELGTRAWDYPIFNLKLAFSEPHWVAGNGTGTASLGSQYVSSILKVPLPRVGVENGFGSLLVEFGIAGLLLWLAWTISLAVACWRVVLKLRQTRLFPIGFAAFWFVVLLLFPITFGTINAYQDYILNAYLWLLIGVLFRLPELLATGPIPLPTPVRAPRAASLPAF